MRTIISIEDPGDPRLADYRDIRERDLVGRVGRFVAEGRVVLEKLVTAGRHRLLSVLVADHRFDGIADVVEAIPESVPVYRAAPRVMDTLVGFPIHRGVLAIGERCEISLATLLAGLPAQALVVGLSGISNHDNMGGLFRNAAAFGADAVLIDSTCCDPFYRKAIRVSVGATLMTPFARAGDASGMVETLKAGGFEVAALSPQGAMELGDWSPKPRVAALFGAEGPGLSPAILARTTSVRITMSGGFDSLNVATTSGIVLHHLDRRRRR